MSWANRILQRSLSLNSNCRFDTTGLIGVIEKFKKLDVIKKFEIVK